MQRLKWLSGLLLFFLIVSFVPLAPADGTAKNGFERQRDRLRKKIGTHGRAVLLSGSKRGVVDETFYYLTGIRGELHPFLIVLPERGADYLFLNSTRDQAKVKRLAELSGIKNILPKKEFAGIFADQSWRNNVYYPFGSFGQGIINRMMAANPGYVLADVSSILQRMRLVKTPEEIATLQKTADITATGLVEVMRKAQPGMYEYELQDIIESSFHLEGAPGCSFPSIIGSGPNSTIIHYMDNIRRTVSGDLVVMDVGAEYMEYAGDITRTIPISGSFTTRQRDVYRIVLSAQRRAIEACGRGVSLNAIDAAARSYITGAGYGSYFTHFTSHSLGLDVHDPDPSRDAPLPRGSVITIEPGIYISSENLGIRIEDDVLVTDNGCQVLSSLVPKDPDDIERLMRED